MTIDNLVTGQRRLAEGVWRVELREPIDGLFTNDRVRWLDETWIVWDIGQDALTLVLEPKPDIN